MKLIPKRFAYALTLIAMLLTTSCARNDKNKEKLYPVFSSSEHRDDKNKLYVLRNEYLRLKNETLERTRKQRLITVSSLEKLREHSQNYNTFLKFFLEKYQGLYKLDDPKSDQLYQIENESSLRSDYVDTQDHSNWCTDFIKYPNFRSALNYTIDENTQFLTEHSFNSREKLQEVLVNKNGILESQLKGLDESVNLNKVMSNMLFGENRKLSQLHFKFSSALNDDLMKMSARAKIDSELELREKVYRLSSLNTDIENKIREQIPSLRNMKFFATESSYNSFDNESFESNKEYSYYIIVGLDPRIGPIDQEGALFAIESLVFESKKEFDKSTIKVFRLKNF